MFILEKSGYMENIYGVTSEKLEEYFLSLIETKFKANQLYTWLYDKKITSLRRIDVIGFLTFAPAFSSGPIDRYQNYLIQLMMMNILD